VFDFHIHSVYSDGRGNIDEIVRKARERRLKVICIADHSSEHSLGLTKKKAEKRSIEIEMAEQKYGVVVLNGVECGILENGRIEKPEFKFDLIIASVHSYLPPEEYYKRLRECIKTQEIHVLGHLHSEMVSLDGRIPEYDLEIIDLAKENCVAIEINSYHKAPPHDIIEEAGRRGLIYSIGSDAHSVERVGDISWAKKQAEKNFRKSILDVIL